MRIEREEQLQLENCNIRIQSAETEAHNLRDEVTRQRIRLEKIEIERQQLIDQIDDLKNELNYSKVTENNFKEQEKRYTHRFLLRCSVVMN